MDEKIDIRAYPIPDWSSRQLAVVQNGKWSCFYNSRNNETVFNYEPYSKKTLSIVQQRLPGGVTNRSSALSMSTKFKGNDDNEHFLNYDSYQLLKKSIKREKMNQQIFVTPTFSKPEKKAITLKNHDCQKLNETFVPSETNIVNEIRPIVPIMPDLSISKNQKDESKITNSNNELKSTDNEKSENDDNLYFSLKRNDAKNHNAFHFFRSMPKQKSSNDKVLESLYGDSASKKSRRCISQLKENKGNDQTSFIRPISKNQIQSHSSLSPTKY